MRLHSLLPSAKLSQRAWLLTIRSSTTKLPRESSKKFSSSTTRVSSLLTQDAWNPRSSEVTVPELVTKSPTDERKSSYHFDLKCSWSQLEYLLRRFSSCTPSAWSSFPFPQSVRLHSCLECFRVNRLGCFSWLQHAQRQEADDWMQTAVFLARSRLLTSWSYLCVCFDQNFLSILLFSSFQAQLYLRTKRKTLHFNP